MLVKEKKGFPPTPSTVDESDEDIPFVTATRIVGDNDDDDDGDDDDEVDRQNHCVHNLTNTFVHTPPGSTHGWQLGESNSVLLFHHPTAVVRIPSNVEQVVMDEPPPPPPPRRRRVGSDEDHPTTNSNNNNNTTTTSSPSSRQSPMMYHTNEERPPFLTTTVTTTLFDPNPHNPAHRLLWQTGRVSRAAFKKTIQLTKEVPKYATDKAKSTDIKDVTQRSMSFIKDASARSATFVQSRTVHARDRTVDVTQRSASFIKDASVRSATFVQSRTVHARDRTVDWYQSNDVGPKTKAAVYYLGDQIKNGTTSTIQSVRTWRVKQ